MNNRSPGQLHRQLRALLWVMLLGGCANEAANGRKWIRDLVFRGVDHVSKGDLKDGISTEKTGWWPFAKKKWFDQSALDIDLDRIRAFYADHGYFDAHVRRQVYECKDGSVNVFISVDEGKATKVEKIRVEGLEKLDSKKAEKLLGRIVNKEGDVYDYNAFESSKQELDMGLKDNGFAYSKVDGKALVDRDKHTAELEVKADHGPIVHMGEVKIEGNGNIPDHSIRNRITWNTGDQFEPAKIGTTQGRLYDLGVFSSVRIELDKQPQERPPITIMVSRGKLHELRLGGGVGVERARQEVRGRAEWTFYNFLGGLRTLKLRLRPAYVVIPDIFKPVQNGIAADNDLSLKQPDIFSSNITLHALIGYDLGIQEGLQYHGPRAQLGIERPFFDEHVLGGISWNLQFLDFFNINQNAFNPLTTPLGFGFKDPYRLAYLEQYVSLDIRDRPLAARWGTYVVVRVEEGTSAVGGDFTYLKVTPEVRGYIPFGKRFTLAGRALLGWLNPNGQVDSPITRRYSLGGPSSHRGFSFGRLAPQVVDQMTGRRIPVGGDAEVLFSLETRIQMVKLWGAWLGLIPFFDAGDVPPNFHAIDMGELHLATGAQLDYETPIGVVRIGMGVRLNRLDPIGPGGLSNPDPGSRLAFFFSIGEAF